MSVRYLDIHSHQNDPTFDQDREEVFARMKEAGVGGVMVGTDKEMSRRAIECADQYENTWATIGQHPTDKHDEIFDEHWYHEAGKHPKVVGIGECGLDYFRMRIDGPGEKKRQRDLFVLQLEFAVHL